MKRTCPYCGKKFLPSRYHPNQRICSSAICQRRRRSEYHRHKLAEDVLYRDLCGDSQRTWLENNPEYMKHYAARRRAKRKAATGKSQLLAALRKLLDLAKNNVALELTTPESSVWLVGPPGILRNKNNVVGAQFVVLQGVIKAKIIRKV